MKTKIIFLAIYFCFVKYGNAQVTPGSAEIENIPASLAIPAPEHIWLVPVLIIRYLPTVDGVYLDQSKCPAWGYESGWKMKLEDMLDNIRECELRTKYCSEESTRFRGYKDTEAKPSLGYKIVEIINVYDHTPPGIAGYENGVKFYFPDYKSIFNRLNVQHYIDDLGVKEVWLWQNEFNSNHPGYIPGFHKPEDFRGPQESNMSSPLTGDISNSYRYDDLPVYSQTYTVYSGNIWRAKDDTFGHIRGHQLESILSYINQKQDGNTKLFWQDFVGRGPNFEAPIGRAGDCHQPPNTKNDYDYGNMTLVESDIEDWNPEGGTKKKVNSETWKNLPYNWPNDYLDPYSLMVQNWYVYWMQNMPGKDNYISHSDNVSKMTNWWIFSGDWDYAINNNIGLYSVITIPYIKLHSDQWNISSNGNVSKILKISSNLKWNLKSDQDWLTFSKSNGSNDTTIEMIATKNMGVVNRTAKITATSEDELNTDSITITQNATEILTVSSANIELNATENSVSVEVTSNTIWEANSDKDWLTVSPDYLVNGNRTLIITANENFYITPRSANIYIKTNNPEINGIITVTQKAAKTTEVTAGNLNNILASKLSTLKILNIGGTIDARDFKTIRDKMPMLEELNLREANIVAYNGLEGTCRDGSYNYQANEIPIHAFYGNMSLKTISLPSSTKTIGEYCFVICDNLETLNIPNGVTNIKEGAFYAIGKLSNLYIPASVAIIGNHTFTLGVTAVEVEGANQNYSSSDGVLFNKNQTSLIHFPRNKTGEYIIPSTVVTIISRAFCCCDKFSSVKFPESLKTIEEYAFEGCNGVSRIEIPEGLETVKSGAFGACSNLSELILPKSVKTIQSEAFYNDVKLIKITSFSPLPVNLSSSSNVFINVNKTTCKLYVPDATTGLYAAANQWKDFINILEIKELNLSSNYKNMASTEGSSVAIEISSNTSWTASSDQTWLTVAPSNGTGNSKLVLTANSNPLTTARKAIVTISAQDVNSKTIQITQLTDFSISLDIALETGWNILSVNNIPDSIDMKCNFQSLIDKTTLVKIQDELGNSLEDWGIFGGWNNGIGEINPSEGYKIKVNCLDTVEICGSPVQYPYPIPLNLGWNIMGFPQTKSIDGLSIIQQLIDKGTLLKVQDELGNSIEDWGIFGGWQNNIGDFMAGEGYKIKVSTKDTLWIYENYPKSTTNLPDMVATMHFLPGIEGNGVDHMNINVVGLPVNMLKAGDELAIFDGTTCVGAVTIIPHHLENQAVSIAVSATDNQGMAGFAEGNQFTLKLWKSIYNQEFILEPEIVKGASTFTKHETTVASLEKYATTRLEGFSGSANTEINCYPNPFSDEVTIEINLATDAQVQVEVLNQLGQKVKTIVSKKQLSNGQHKLTWNGRNAEVAPGIYHLSIKINDSVIHRKIILTK